MSEKQDHYCEKRGCKNKSPEMLMRMSGYGFEKDKVDVCWYCEACFEEVNGDVLREFQVNEKKSLKDKEEE